MLKVIRNPEFLVPVTVLTPADGGQSEGRFKARFRALTKSELEAHEMVTGDGATAFLREVVQGWEGLVDDENAAFEFSDPNFNALLELPHFRVAMIKAYFDNTSGIKAAKRGN
ncbi:hypothetical protein [Paracoccus sp. IB05]|uniref:hypothetical protein n=1 Tax=Paracoccus sp. IB05 TaxID=2779367 RepID=UPI0018E785BC|nr:hypothetical protein [Paracoccus sp. IB05]MBJ2150604.1 hypothetical protein [Paracoccus sp. IB05]